MLFRSVIDATMDALHRILAELRPGVLDDLGLPAAIRWLAEEFKRRAGIDCTVQMTGGDPADEVTGEGSILASQNK